MKALIVIDMQEAYVGRNRKNCPYASDQLVRNIHLRIADYEQRNDLVVYIKNKGKAQHASELVPELRRASGLVFEKSKASCFSNDHLLACLREKSIEAIELAGVDGNCCVAISAIEGKKLGFEIRFHLSCIGIANAEKFASTRRRLEEANISVLEGEE